MENDNSGEIIKEKKKIIILFPHAPNPRMIKRIDALKNDFNVQVIYWDRGTGNDKKNEIPAIIERKVIIRKGNEGNPLGRIGTTLQVMRDAIKFIKKNKPDFLYLSKTDMLMVGVIYKKFFNRNTKIIYEVSDLHTLIIDPQRKFFKKIVSYLLNRIERILCKSIRLLVVTSEYFYKYYYRDFVDSKKLLFIPNTPNPEVFKNFSRKKNKVFTIGFIGAVRYGKQLEMLIDAAQECNVNVLIAGIGVDYNRILQYANGKEFVEVYGAYIYEKEIKSLYERVDCVYSVYDASMKNVQIALPNRLYEAVYTTTPIIAAKNTYLGEIVEENNIGISVKYDDFSDLVNAINNLKNNEGLIESFIDNSMRLKETWVLEQYNLKLRNMINNYN